MNKILSKKEKTYLYLFCSLIIVTFLLFCLSLKGSKIHPFFFFIVFLLITLEFYNNVSEVQSYSLSDLHLALKSFLVIASKSKATDYFRLANSLAYKENLVSVRYLSIFLISAYFSFVFLKLDSLSIQALNTYSISVYLFILFFPISLYFEFASSYKVFFKRYKKETKLSLLSILSQEIQSDIVYLTHYHYSPKIKIAAIEEYEKSREKATKSISEDRDLDLIEITDYIESYIKLKAKTYQSFSTASNIRSILNLKRRKKAIENIKKDNLKYLRKTLNKKSKKLLRAKRRII